MHVLQAVPAFSKDRIPRTYDDETIRTYKMMHETFTRRSSIYFYLMLRRNGIHMVYIFFDTFLNRQTNLKSMFSALTVK
jgi:flagellar motor switch protein FliM